MASLEQARVSSLATRPRLPGTPPPFESRHARDRWRYAVFMCKWWDTEADVSPTRLYKMPGGLVGRVGIVLPRILAGYDHISYYLSYESHGTPT
jgi:hypothetical protein